MCIYYTDRKELNHDSREHVIPAAIGGKVRLPIDYVSREFNNDISKLEMDFIRMSIISISREIEGPGKRGKLGPRHETKSEVFVFNDSNDANIFSLGYIQKGVGFEIPHVIYDTTTGKGNARACDVEQIKGFKRDCQCVNILRIKTVTDNTLPVNIILFGIKDGIECNFDYFFFKNESNGIELTEGIIQRFGEGIVSDQIQRESYVPIFNRRIVFDIAYFRIFAKMAFNYLAYKRGKDFALNGLFDPVRKWISNGGENNFGSLSNRQSNPFASLRLPEACHLIYLIRVEDILLAKVMIYGGFCVDIVLSYDFKLEFQSEAIISDWKNQREYELLEYLAFQYNH